MPVRPSSISRIHNVLLSFLLRSKLGHGILLRSLVVVISHRYPWWKNRILKNQDGISNGARSKDVVPYSIVCIVRVIPTSLFCRRVLYANISTMLKVVVQINCDERISRTLDEKIHWTVDISRC